MRAKVAKIAAFRIASILLLLAASAMGADHSASHPAGRVSVFDPRASEGLAEAVVSKSPPALHSMVRLSRPTSRPHFVPIVIFPAGGGGGTNPTPTVFPPGLLEWFMPQVVVSGSPLELEVAVSGSKPFTFIWTRQGQGGGEILALRTLDRDFDVFAIPEMKAELAGTYEVLISNGAGSVAHSAAITVTPRPQSITIRGPDYPRFGDGPFALSVSTGSGLAADITLEGPAKWNPASGFLTFVGAGPVVVRAHQSGNADFASTAVAELHLNVDRSDQRVDSFAPLLDVSYGTPPIPLQATLSSTLSPVFTARGPAILSGSILTLTGAGTVTIEAGHPGNQDYYPAAPVSRSFQAKRLLDSIEVGLVGDRYVGEITVSLSVRSVSTRAPLLRVDGPAQLESASAIRLLGTGTVQLTATLEADDHYAGATNSMKFQVLDNPRVYFGISRDRNRGGMELIFRGKPMGVPFRLERSTDLEHWQEWRTAIIDASGEARLSDTISGSGFFYRARFVR